MSSGDVGALVEITGTVRTLHPRVVVERLISIDFPADRLTTTIIGIGGPKNNQVVRQLLQDTDAGYTFEGTILRSKRSGQTYRPEYDSDGHPVIDYGLALKVPNPYEVTEWFYAFSGCHTYGCLAAARLVSVFEPRALEYLRAIHKRAGRPSGIAVVVSARVVNNAVTKVTMVELIRLPQSPRKNALAGIHGTANEGTAAHRGGDTRE
jgi:hypothetical protein